MDGDRVNATLCEAARRLRMEFGITRADLFTRRVVDELGEPAATYWFALYLRLLETKRESGENVVRFARWAYDCPGDVRFRREDVESLDAVAGAMPGSGWATLRAWLARSSRRKKRGSHTEPHQWPAN